MFIKLTRFDNRPVWLNAGFIVTVEPRREGSGAIVVPIGDGLDYDVRETPEEVLRLLDGAPEPKVVPVPVSDCLTKAPASVAPETAKGAEKPAEMAAEPAAPVEKPAAEAKPKKRVTRTRKTTKKAAEKPAESAPEGSAPEEAKSAESVSEPEPVAPPPPPPPPPVLELNESEVLRLRKLAPKSLGKLKNTLASQFRIADIGANVAALAERGVFTLDGSRVLWAAEGAE